MDLDVVRERPPTTEPTEHRARLKQDIFVDRWWRRPRNSVHLRTNSGIDVQDSRKSMAAPCIESSCVKVRQKVGAGHLLLVDHSETILLSCNTNVCMSWKVAVAADGWMAASGTR